MKQDVRIEPVGDRRGWSQFIGLPSRLYGADPAWVAPLIFEQKQRLGRKNPFFEHARMGAWTASIGGRTVGRITAQVDQLYLDTHSDRAGYFGMIEADDDPAIMPALLSAAEDWLREQGMDYARGPFNLSINEECGLLVDGFDTPPSVMMGHARPGYGSAIERAGYQGVKDLLAYRIRPDFDAPRVMTRLAHRVARNVRVRCMHWDRFADEMRVLRDIFNDAWSENWNFVPITEREFREMGEMLKLLVNKDLVQIAEVDGQPVAFIVALPNINEAARDLGGRLLPFGWAKLLWRLKVSGLRSARVPLMGVRKAWQHTRMGPALAFLVIDAVRKTLTRRGIREVEMSWILEDNDGMRNIIETIGGDLYKRYRIYEKPLS